MRHIIIIIFCLLIGLPNCYRVRQTWRMDEAKKASMEMVRSLKEYVKKTGKPCVIFVKEFSYKGLADNYRNHTPLVYYIIDGLIAEQIKFKAYNAIDNSNSTHYSVDPGGHVSPTMLLYGEIKARTDPPKENTKNIKYIFTLTLKDLRSKIILWEKGSEFF